LVPTGKIPPDLSLNIEQQNKEPQNHEGFTSIFDIPCSKFCGLEARRAGVNPAPTKYPPFVKASGSASRPEGRAYTSERELSLPAQARRGGFLQILLLKKLNNY
jgi:hypothetical protein